MSCTHLDTIRAVTPSAHPLVQSLEPGEDWIWCYADEVMLEPA